MPDSAPHDTRPATHAEHFPVQATLLAQWTLEEADRCVLCGLCLPHCPTYRKTGDENESPRGRVVLMRALASGALPASERLAVHLSRCLSCRACERVCPSGVRYGQLIEAGRALMHIQKPAAWPTRMLLSLSTRPYLLRRIGAALRAYQRSGLQRIVRTSGMLRLLHWQRLESLLPTLAATLPRDAFHPAQGARRGCVGLFLGCVARVLDAETLAAAVRLLTRLGFDVVIPNSQTCCGALHREAGQPDQARVLARCNLDAFRAANIDAVITVASGCGAVLADAGKNDESIGDVRITKTATVEAGHVGERSRPRQKLAVEDSNTEQRVRILDIHQFLADIKLPESMMLAPLPVTIAVQDPCSLRNVLRAEQAVYALLERIPAARIVPLAENHLCCGGAGAYPLRQPAMADRLRADKLAHLQQLQPAVLATANLGCALHLISGLRAQGLNIEVLHPLVVFERQLRETPV
jgi:glycolate oxidase iron-sulfur subunit